MTNEPIPEQIFLPKKLQAALSLFFLLAFAAWMSWAQPLDWFSYPLAGLMVLGPIIINVQTLRGGNYIQITAEGLRISDSFRVTFIPWHGLEGFFVTALTRNGVALQKHASYLCTESYAPARTPTQHWFGTVPARPAVTLPLIFGQDVDSMVDTLNRCLNQYRSSCPSTDTATWTYGDSLKAEPFPLTETIISIGCGLSSEQATGNNTYWNVDATQVVSDDHTWMTDKSQVVTQTNGSDSGFLSPNGLYCADINEGSDFSQGRFTNLLTVWRRDTDPRELVVRRDFGSSEPIHWSDDSEFVAWIEFAVFPCNMFRQGVSTYAPSDHQRLVVISISHKVGLTVANGPRGSLTISSFKDGVLHGGESDSSYAIRVSELDWEQHAAPWKNDPLQLRVSDRQSVRCPHCIWVHEFECEWRKTNMISWTCKCGQRFELLST